MIVIKKNSANTCIISKLTISLPKISGKRMTKSLLIFLILVNVVTFCVYVDDKRRAKKRAWRTSESTLVILALIGGSVGALLAMLLARHKTRHIEFVIGIPLIIIVQILLAIFIIS